MQCWFLSPLSIHTVSIYICSIPDIELINNKTFYTITKTTLSVCALERVYVYMGFNLYALIYLTLYVSIIVHTYSSIHKLYLCMCFCVHVCLCVYRTLLPLVECDTRSVFLQICRWFEFRVYFPRRSDAVQSTQLFTHNKEEKLRSRLPKVIRAKWNLNIFIQNLNWVCLCNFLWR